MDPEDIFLFEVFAKNGFSIAGCSVEELVWCLAEDVQFYMTVLKDTESASKWSSKERRLLSRRFRQAVANLIILKVKHGQTTDS
jgi:hypothetical protein